MQTNKKQKVMNRNMLTFQVDESVQDGLRADVFLSERLPDVTRSQLKQRCIAITINRKISKLSQIVTPGDVISFELKDIDVIDLIPESMDLEVLYESDRVIVINKPQGIVVHPGAGNASGTLVNGLIYHNELEGFENSIRPGIVHRLDKDTSGVLVVAKDPDAHQFLAKQFQDRTVNKLYLAIAHKPLTKDNLLFTQDRNNWVSVKNHIGRDPKNRQKFLVLDSLAEAERGKLAVSHFRVKAAGTFHLLLQVKIDTGRTHQIRVHCKYLGAPIVGDPIYCHRRDPETLMLHAFKIRLILPGEEQFSEFEAPIPGRFKNFIETQVIKSI